MDKNSLIGFGLLAALLMGYLFYNQKMQEQVIAKHTADSIANVKLHPEILKKDSIQHQLANTVTDTAIANAPLAVAAVENTLENDDVKITFSSLGAQPTKILLKKFVTAQKKPLYVFNPGQNSFDFNFKNATGAIVHSKAINFLPTSTSSNSLSYTAPNGVTISYTLPTSGYMMDMKILGNNTIAANQNMNIDWNSIAPQTEYDHVTEMQYNQYCFNETKEGVDYFTIRKEDKKEFKNGLKWLSFKQHYFTTILLSDNTDFATANIATKPTNDTSNLTIAKMDASLTIPASQEMKFKIYSGPNDYKILKSYNKDLEEIIPLGYGLMTFVKYINKWIIMPIFNALSSKIANYGIVILLLTLIVRLLMSPITYKSYVSSAKMKVLKPEIDELKAKHGDDQQAFGVAQMALFKSAGVSPLGGCLPSLAQLPIFFALLSFFPNAIQLRQQPFLWAKDLSTFDSVYNLPFNIPAYGNHVSLFTLLFVATSLIMALYNKNMTPTDNNNPALKYLPYIMPIMFLGIFNRLSSSLTFYYFVSNVITLILQFVIQNYIIDHDKIHAQLQANKTKPVKENKLMQKMQEMQKQNAERMKKLDSMKK